MNRNGTAREAGPDPGSGRTSAIAVWAAVAAVCSAAFAGVTAYSNWQRNDYEIQNKVFKVQVDDDWRILIEQIGGPLYRIQTVTLTPTFQERGSDRANYVPGNEAEFPLRDLETYTENGTRYLIDNPRELLCPPKTGQPKLAASCAETALWRVDVKFDVSGDSRTFVCRPGQCASL